ncbi:MAG: TadE/TadG family type IV pilus assembly protein [Acidimicrobiales bacterium]
MTLRNRAPRPAHPRCSSDGGSAILELALVSVVLLTVVFGIINFGLLLSFNQDLTRAAAEGARAAAVAYPPSGAVDDATDATEEAVQSFNKSCTGGGLTCLVRQHDCSDPVPDTNGDDPNIANCVQVDLIYDYDGYPLVVPVPLIAPFMPSQIRATSDARVNL